MADHHGAATYCRLDDLGTLVIRGPDTHKFLQGQLSADMEQLTPGTLLRAGLHTPQGRALAVPWLTALDDAVLAILPLESLDSIATTLRRYVLRAKLTLEPAADRFVVYGVYGTLPPARDPTAAQPSGWHLVRGYDPHRDERALLLVAAGSDAADAAHALMQSTPLMSRAQWRALDIAAGLPQVHAANAGQFVAQMLNLDCIHAISFTKGCYTGQEVIARAHYRGRVKRRMQRFATLAPHAAATLAAGTEGRFADGRAFRVVDVVQRPDGRSELLAVTTLPDEMTTADADLSVAASAPRLAVAVLPLPYPLP